MTLRHLKIFKTVCKCRSITAAADELNMTQPAVSIAIKELEGFYQARLFDRLGRKIYLTEAGEALKTYADMVLDGFEASVLALRVKSNLNSCRLGVNVSVAETFLPDVLQELKERIPGVQTRVTVENARAIERRLTDNEIDIAILDGVIENRRWAVKRFFTDEMCVYCAPSLYEQERITLEKLAQKQLLLREEGSASRSCVEAAFFARGLNINLAVESASTLSLIELARRAMGFTILPSRLPKAFYAEHSLHTVRVEDERFLRHYYLIYHAKKHITAPMQALIDMEF